MGSRAAAASVVTAAVLLVAGALQATDAPSATQPPGAREDCSTRSGANFPRAFTDPDNLVVGPLVLVGGAHTSEGTVRRFGGNKFPLLVKQGHTVTVALSRRARETAALGYGRLPQ
jgi:hypothetical protein